MFSTPTDIANRCMQHLGVPRIADGALTTEQSRPAIEASFCYDKLRRSELEKSIWSFAVRRAIMRKIIAGTTKTYVPAAYSAAATYGMADVVQYTNIYWISNIASNLANTPGLGGLTPAWSPYFGPMVSALWDTAVAYLPGDLVHTTTVAYICILAHTAHAQPNTTYWLPLTGTLTDIVFFQPIGYNITGSSVRNIYRMPANFLRMAPLNEKTAGTSRQNTTAGMAFNDYELEAGYLLSALQGATARPDPLILRFVADQTTVALCDETFCEALAARMAIELAEPLTQSKERIASSIALYDNQIAVAKMINAIEAGSTDPEPSTPNAPQGGQGGGQGGRG